MSTWKDRLKVLLPPAYDPVIRRPLQSVILYEAQRCIRSKVDSLRPFQRKIAFLNQANALLNSLDFIPPHHRMEIMWRTGTSKEPMDAEIAWKRSRLLEKELTNLAEKIKPFVGEGLLTHQQACDAMVQDMYETFSKEAKEASKDDASKTDSVANEGKAGERPPNWEHAHNNVMLCFRLYYKFSAPDPTFPEPRPPIPIVVPSEKPQKGGNPNSHFVTPGGMPIPGMGSPGFGASIQQRSAGFVGSALAGPSPAEERAKTLKEVREHLDLLKQFEGAIPEEEINRRKRELFLALPAAPPAYDAKRLKM